MQLTYNYQMLGQAYLGNSAGDLYIRIYAKINSQNTATNTSNISYQSRLYFSGGYIISQGQTKVEMRGTSINNTTTNWQNFEGRQNGRFNNGETVVKTITTTIQHDSSGNASINASAIFSSVGSWGWSGTASGTATLPTLHKAPEITNCTITAENNTQLNTLGLATGTIAQYLSDKTFTITADFYDDATLTNFSIYHNNILIGTSSTNTLRINFADVSELQTTLSEGVYYVGLVASITDIKNGRNTASFNFPVIKYTRPSMEVTSTAIRRKTGGGITLTENLAVLNFTGTYYNGNDVIGNNNTPALQYKIWKRDLTEPSYSTTKVRQLDTDNILNYETNQITTFTTSNNDITISNFEIEDVGYRNAYKYKIKVSDSFTDTDASPYIKEDKVPTGVSVWTEYKDRVDFLKITQGNKNIFAYEKNDTFSLSENYFGGGYVTSSAESIQFTIPVDKSLANITSISVSSLKANFRSIAGNYIGGSNAYISGGYDYSGDGNYTIQAEKCSNNLVSIWVTKSSDYNVTNNTPVAIELAQLNLNFN